MLHFVEHFIHWINITQLYAGILAFLLAVRKPPVIAGTSKLSPLLSYPRDSAGF